MNNFEFVENILGEEVDRIEFILKKCRGKRVLDLGCVQHSFGWAIKSKNWLHKKICKVARYTLGVDYLLKDINELKRSGFNVICGDVTKPLNIEDKFDIIVAGNLIEHLTDFEGFFENLKNLLVPDGEVLISTANPFYRDQYFYTAFKKSFLINPEHTCWIDPVALNQLARRFGFETREIHFIKRGWKLGDLILEGKYQSYDMFHGRWVRREIERNVFDKLVDKSLLNLFYIFCKITGKFKFNKYPKDELADKLRRYIMGKSFQFFWNIYKMFIVSSRMNKYELYVSVLKK